uniref:Uncharacterized protein n=1 Tax=Acrobeloides nanus TaxID=290746 RepID=A0A914DG25_9BILA
MYSIVIFGIFGILALIQAFPTAQDLEITEPPYEEIECGHRIGGDVFNRIYILKPQAEHVNHICHVGVPTNVNILLLPDFYDPKSYARILTGDNDGYKRASEKLYSTPEDAKKIKIVRWFVPGEKAALLLHAATSEDSLGFVITKTQKHKPFHYGFDEEINT